MNILVIKDICYNKWHVIYPNYYRWQYYEQFTWYELLWLLERFKYDKWQGIYKVGVTQSGMTSEFFDARLGFSLNYVQKNTNQVWWWLTKIYSIPSPTQPYPTLHMQLSSHWYDWTHAIHETRFVLFITHCFSPFFLRRHVCECRTNLNEIFPKALFEKNRSFATW